METNNMNTRAKFEEIWPVPDGVYWDSEDGEYMPREWLGADKYFELATEWDARLDTFTRCQETIGPVMSLVDDLIRELDNAAPWIKNLAQRDFATDATYRAKQLIGAKE